MKNKKFQVLERITNEHLVNVEKCLPEENSYPKYEYRLSYGNNSLYCWSNERYEIYQYYTGLFAVERGGYISIETELKPNDHYYPDLDLDTLKTYQP